MKEITSKRYLNRALENAKRWCEKRFPEYLEIKDFDYEIFSYVIDNSIVGTAMLLDREVEGLIRVSTYNLEKLIKREEVYRNDPLYKKIRKPVEVDPESMFVHEITEEILLQEVSLEKFGTREWRFLSANIINFLCNSGIHQIARTMENINRTERGLSKWPEY